MPQSAEAPVHAQKPAPLLFTPFSLRSVTARNRVVVSPMCQYLSEDGGPTDWHLVHLGRFAIGGAGIVFCEETAIEPHGRKTHQCAGIYTDRHVAAYRRITDMLRSLGSVPGIQLGHAGRKGSVGGAMRGWPALTADDAAHGEPPWQTMAPSAISQGAGFPPPREMDLGDIKASIAAWRDAARRSADAGFDICEIHGAHGYLIHQFLSPTSNRRTDGYGGSLEGRMRYALEVAEAVRSAWPADKPLFYRCASVDGKGGYWDLNDTITLARELAARGVDMMACSSGGMASSSTMKIVPRVPGYQVPYSRRVRAEAGIGTVAVGLITRPQHAEDILQNGDADLIALARELMCHSDWPAHAARDLGMDDWMDLYPPAYGYRLRKRIETSANYPPGTETVVPITQDEAVEYRWPDCFDTENRQQ